jgi:O-antigen/teichoic acid export membrane protein
MLGVRGYLLAILLADAATAVFILFYLLLRSGFSDGDASNVGVSQLLSYAAPLIPTSALWWSIAYFDRFVLLSYHGTGAVGLLAAAGRIPSLITFGAGVFFEAWQYSALRVSEGERAALFERIYGMLCAGLVALCAVLMLLARPLVGYLFASDFHGAASLVPLLVLGALFSALSSFLGSAYMVKMRSRMSLITALLGASVNLVLCLLMVPRRGAYGAVSATVVSYLVIFICRSVQVRRMIPFAQHGWRLGSAAVLLLALGLALGSSEPRWGYPLALLALLPFLRESVAMMRLIWQFLQEFFKKKQKQP